MFCLRHWLVELSLSRHYNVVGKAADYTCRVAHNPAPTHIILFTKIDTLRDVIPDPGTLRESYLRPVELGPRR